MKGSKIEAFLGPLARALLAVLLATQRRRNRGASLPTGDGPPPMRRDSISGVHGRPHLAPQSPHAEGTEDSAEGLSRQSTHRSFEPAEERRADWDRRSGFFSIMDTHEQASGFRGFSDTETGDEGFDFRSRQASGLVDLLAPSPGSPGGGVLPLHSDGELDVDAECSPRLYVPSDETEDWSPASSVPGVCSSVPAAAAAQGEMQITLPAKQRPLVQGQFMPLGMMAMAMQANQCKPTKADKGDYMLKGELADLGDRDGSWSPAKSLAGPAKPSATKAPMKRKHR